MKERARKEKMNVVPDPAAGKSRKKRVLECHIGSFHNSRIDPVLEANGFTHSLVSFAIPTLGILFKCRAEGGILELEFAAFFALMKFLRNRLKQEKIRNIRVSSSNPEFVFAFTPGSPHLAEGSARRRMMTEYVKGYDVSISYVEHHRNKTRTALPDYPSLPEGKRPVIMPDFGDERKTSFRPFQRGIKL